METEVSQQLLVEVSRIYKEEGTLTSSLLSALQFVFQSSLLPALDLIDNSKITKIVSPSGRCVFKVIGSSGTHYICLSVLKYCSCAAFKFSALKKKGYILCKHLLAIQLGLAMERLNEEEVSDEAVACMIQQID